MNLQKLGPLGLKLEPMPLSDNFTFPSIWAGLDYPWRHTDVVEGFNRFDHTPMASKRSLSEDFHPMLDVHQTDKEFQISLQMPGISEKDINISLTADMVTIGCEKKEERKESNKRLYRLESRYGSFSRSISMPRGMVATDKAEAIFKNGVLTVKLPKSAEHKGGVKKIPIVTDENDSSANLNETTSKQD